MIEIYEKQSSIRGEELEFGIKPERRADKLPR